MPFGQYDDANNSMDALGLNAGDRMYSDINEGNGKGGPGKKPLKIIILASLMLIISVVLIGLTTNKLITERKLISKGDVVQADYSAYDNTFSVSVTLDDGTGISRTWKSSWLYKTNAEKMPVYYMIDGDTVYITPELSTAVWILAYVILGALTLASVFGIASVYKKYWA